MKPYAIMGIICIVGLSLTFGIASLAHAMRPRSTPPEPKPSLEYVDRVGKVIDEAKAKQEKAFKMMGDDPYGALLLNAEVIGMLRAAEIVLEKKP